MDPVSWLAQTTGSTLTAVTEARHQLGGETLLHFWLHFEGHGATQFHGMGDSLILTPDDTPYSPYDIGKYGTVGVDAASADDPLAGAIGRRLLGGDVLRSGFVLRFEGVDLIIEQVADEWVISTS